MAWRYYVKRVGGDFIDVNTQLASASFTWALSGPGDGKVFIAEGTAAPDYHTDGQLVWGKWHTMLFAEEDGALSWAGIVSATPTYTDKGLEVELVSVVGWLYGVPFTGRIYTWQPDAFSVVRSLIDDTVNKHPRIPFVVSTNMSGVKIGDARPPTKPTVPPRRKGQTTKKYKASSAYKNATKAVADWNKAYSEKKPFELAWWEEPMVGESIDTICKENGLEYRERVAWYDKANLVARYYVDLDTDIRNRRTDIQFIDGQNIVDTLDPKDTDVAFANHVIGLGSGEGKAMVRSEVGLDDGRLYQAAYMSYKEISNASRIRGLITTDFGRANRKGMIVDSFKVWDVDGMADIKSLKCGDEVYTSSNRTVPAFGAYVRILKITRDPASAVVELTVETI